MSAIVAWFEAHDELAGWAQFFGAMLAIAITYFTAFAPSWRRKRQLKNSAARLLANGYEAIESYHRTSENFMPFPLSLRFAAMTMSSVVDEMNRFPIYELEDQGSRSIARCLVAMGIMLSGLRLMLETEATRLESQVATEEDQDFLRNFVGERLDTAKTMLSGGELKRPEWPAPGPSAQ